MNKKRLLIGAAAILAALVMAACGVVGATASPLAGGNGDNAVNAAAAQGYAPTGNVITVTGTGQAFGEADFATVEMGIDVRSAEVGSAIDQSNQVIEEMTAALNAVGVESTDIQTMYFSVWQEDEFSPQTGMPTGERVFHVTNTVQVRIRNVDTVSDVIDAALTSGANQVYGLYFSIEDTTALESQARAEAVADARARAEELAAAMGVTLGAPVGISEGFMGGPFYPGPYPQGAGGGGGPAIAPGPTSVGVTVTISYAIGE